jgi:hypothetical protein
VTDRIAEFQTDRCLAAIASRDPEEARRRSATATWPWPCRQGALKLVKTIYALMIALWLVSGVGMHAYFSRAAQGTAQVEEKRDLYLRQFENDDAVAQQIRETHGRSNAIVGGAYAAWVAAGALIGLVGVRSQFQKAGKSFDA